MNDTERSNHEDPTYVVVVYKEPVDMEGNMNYNERPVMMIQPVL